MPTRLTASLDDKNLICSFVNPPFGIDVPSKLALRAELGTGGEIRSDAVDVHGDGYSPPVAEVAVENRDVVGWSRADVDPARLLLPLGGVECPLGAWLGERNAPGANGRVSSSLNPEAVRCNVPGLGAGTWVGRGASGSMADIASR